MKLYIRNMACESCKLVVKEALEKLHLQPQIVELGEAEIKGDLSSDKQKKLSEAIREAGLELIENKEGILLEKIKKEIQKYAYTGGEKPSRKLSLHLTEKLNYSYSYLASFFSSMEAKTVEQYVISLKVERAKEMILFKELTLSEIAHQLNYSSVAHLSAQFKKVTGLTPSHFKALKEKKRIVLQQL